MPSATPIITERFIRDLSRVYSERVLRGVESLLATLHAAPDIGSHLLPESIRQEFGDNVRKMIVAPFDLIYEYDPAARTVTALALIHAKTAW